jgi:hypothetical protein
MGDDRGCPDLNYELRAAIDPEPWPPFTPLDPFDRIVVIILPSCERRHHQPGALPRTASQQITWRNDWA